MSVTLIAYKMISYTSKTRWSCYRVKLKQRENCQEFQLTVVLEFRIGVLKIRNLRSEMGHWKRGGVTLGHCPKPNSYECELIEREFLPSISYEKFRLVVVVCGELRFLHPLCSFCF